MTLYLWDSDVAEVELPDFKELRLADDNILASTTKVINHFIVDGHLGEAAR